MLVVPVVVSIPEAREGRQPQSCQACAKIPCPLPRLPSGIGIAHGDDGSQAKRMFNAASADIGVGGERPPPAAADVDRVGQNGRPDVTCKRHQYPLRLADSPSYAVGEADCVCAGVMADNSLRAIGAHSPSVRAASGRCWRLLKLIEPFGTAPRPGLQMP